MTKGDKQNWICRIFGHKIDLIEQTILNVKRSAVNKYDFKNDFISCKRCGERKYD